MNFLKNSKNNAPALVVPTNVFWFEVLLYASLLLDALSAAFLSDLPDDLSDATRNLLNLTTASLLLFFVYLVWLAARHRRGWPRWVLLASLALSVVSVGQALDDTGLQLAVLVELVSCALTAFGLFLSFTGDAQDWFRNPNRP